ncbi:speckle-type POZ protein [Orussus abietinus]|uniref:speckle-type POZ protein n=1 Tax=Orussus abietinus TaxID=222816 RepID=UPI000624F385|nr:speckle-type POZ protein [Orussus abietinus]
MYAKRVVISDENFGMAHKCTECFLPMFQSKSFVDVTFRVQGTEIPAHRAVLKKSSSYFHGIFTNGMQEEQGVVDVADVDVEIFSELLNFVYGASFQNIRENAERLLVVADKYDFKDLQAVCATVLSDQLSITNVVHVLGAAIPLRVQAAKIKAIHFLKEHCESIIQTEDFQSLMHIKPKVMMEIFCAVCTQLQGFSTSDSICGSLHQSNDNITPTCLPFHMNKVTINSEKVSIECNVHDFRKHYNLRHTFEL